MTRRRHRRSIDSAKEREILSDPQLLHRGVSYADKILLRRWPEWEQNVESVRNPSATLLKEIVVYATRFCVTDRWTYAENKLLAATRRTKDSMDGRDGRYLPAFSTLIIASMPPDDCYLTAQSLAVDYARNVIGGEWNDLEKLILKSKCHPMVGVDYASRIKKARWLAFEDLLFIRPASSDLYRILTWYASLVAKGRWEKGEEFILAQPPSYESLSAIVDYAHHGIKGRWAKGEEFLLAQPPSDVPGALILKYATHVIKGRWLEAEHRLQGCAETLWEYADKAIKGPLPTALHNAMVLGSLQSPTKKWVKRYLRKYCK